MSVSRDLKAERPDVLDLIGPDFDFPSAEPARHTLIICSAPRTGSYELCRHLVAAGIGVPMSISIAIMPAASLPGGACPRPS